MSSRGDRVQRRAQERAALNARRRELLALRRAQRKIKNKGET